MLRACTGAGHRSARNWAYSVPCAAAGYCELGAIDTLLVTYGRIKRAPDWQYFVGCRNHWFLCGCIWPMESATVVA